MAFDTCGYKSFASICMACILQRLSIRTGIPHVGFHVTSHFSVVVNSKIEFHVPHFAMPDDSEPFIVPAVPHEIHMTKAELPLPFHYPKEAQVLELFRDTERRSYGIVINSFDELAPEYVDILKEEGTRVWNVGPLTGWAVRGGGREENSDHDQGMKRWLDAMDDRSVLYIAFGTECIFSNEQLREMAVGLQSSGKPFIWVVRSGGGGLETIDEWLPEGFEGLVEGRGVILRGWAPQLLILNHPAVGGFLTHCGWNSTVEALAAGVPMIAWPLHSDQFINERLIVQVLGTGVAALEGVKRSIHAHQKETVKADAVKKVIEQVMGGGDEAKEMRRKANKFKELSRSVLEGGGSSHVNLTRMIEELTRVAKDKRSKAQS